MNRLIRAISKLEYWSNKVITDIEDLNKSFEIANFPTMRLNLLNIIVIYSSRARKQAYVNVNRALFSVYYIDLNFYCTPFLLHK